MVAKTTKRPPAGSAEPATVRRTLALPIPTNLELIAAGVVLLMLIGGAIGLYLKGHADGYAGGYARAEAIYQKLMADQAAANHKAIEESTQQAAAAADRQAKAEAAYDAALQELDAASGGEGAANCGLDQRRVNDLNSIK